ncbi:MAG: nickel pincer cofactor biosynthesis protein LarB [Polyangiaceae bacterium]|nr:nickel pincer cofactor biosynthesis protein LarB [Polyangiaceae bacterium]
MDRAALLQLLVAVREGGVEPAQAAEALAVPAVADLGHARVDLDREARLGVPEVVYGAGKTAAQIADIVGAIAGAGQSVLVTRVAAEVAAVVRGRHPDLAYDQLPRLLWRKAPLAPPPSGPPVAVVCAGTSDLPVAEEAARTLELFGCVARRFTDVGVAGLHRLLAVLPELREAAAVVVVAGMEGALPSVVGGLVRAPVVAVPTSVGYGASLGGLAALLGMLGSCASGITVVNIDNGFGAALAVVRMRQAGWLGRDR